MHSFIHVPFQGYTPQPHAYAVGSCAPPPHGPRAAGLSLEATRAGRRILAKQTGRAGSSEGSSQVRILGLAWPTSGWTENRPLLRRESGGNRFRRGSLSGLSPGNSGLLPPWVSPSQGFPLTVFPPHGVSPHGVYPSRCFFPHGVSPSRGFSLTGFLSHLDGEPLQRQLQREGAALAHRRAAVDPPAQQGGQRLTDVQAQARPAIPGPSLLRGELWSTLPAGQSHVRQARIVQVKRGGLPHGQASADPTK